MALLTTMLTAGSGGANQDLNTGSSPTFNNLTLTGGITVSGAAILKTNLTVEGTTTLSGAATLKTSLNVEGATTLSGNAVAKGTFLVEGATTLSGAATMKGTATIEGAVVAKTSLNVEGATTLSGNAVAKGTLLVEGATTISGAATFKSTATIEGAVVAKTSLNVEGATTLSGNAVAKGTFLVEGATTLSGAATVKGITTFEAAVVMKTTLNVEGATTLSGAAVLKSTLNVQGETTLSGTVTIKTVGFCNTPSTSTEIANKGYVDTAVSSFSGINKNLIIGGNFDTNPWQRGTSFTAPADGAYGADRFQTNVSGAGVFNILKTADAPAVADAGIFTSNCYHWDVTTADGSIAASDQYVIRYEMEGYDFAQIAQRTFTISFWVKSTKTGIFSLGISNSGGDRSYVSEYTVNTTDTWEKKTITVTASPSAGTWNYTTGTGLRMRFSIAAGSNVQTSSLSTWNSDGLYASTNQVNGMDSTSNNFKLALIKVEPGSSATAWEVRPEEEELALCQRYYEKTFNMSVAPATATGSFQGAITYRAFVAGATTSGMAWDLKARKRIVPTITFYNPGSANTTWYNQIDAGDSGASGTVSFGESGGYLSNAQVAADGVGEAISIHATADAEL